MMRNVTLGNNEVYHIYSKSIAGYQVFNNKDDYARMQNTISYYKKAEPETRLSEFIGSNKFQEMINCEQYCSQEKTLINIIAYCIMPTHIHLVLKQLKDEGISVYMNKVLNSYSRYFNVKHKRKGPLWESRFKRVHVATDEQLMHLTRYLHLNPVTAYLVDNPKNWFFSSYGEYAAIDNSRRICVFGDVLKINPKEYARFVESRIDDQRELAKIKAMLID